MKIKRVLKGCLNSLLDEIEKSNKLTNRKALKLLQDSFRCREINEVTNSVAFELSSLLV